MTLVITIDISHKIYSCCGFRVVWLLLMMLRRVACAALQAQRQQAFDCFCCIVIDRINYRTDGEFGSDPNALKGFSTQDVIEKKSRTAPGAKIRCCTVPPFCYNSKSVETEL